MNVGYGIVQADSEKLHAKLEITRARVLNMNKAIEALGKYMAKYEQSVFVNEGDMPGLAHWAPLAESTLKDKSRLAARGLIAPNARILERYTPLRTVAVRAFETMQAEASKKGLFKSTTFITVSIDTSNYSENGKNYALYHQTGSGYLKPRPFMPPASYMGEVLRKEAKNILKGKNPSFNEV